MKTPFPRGTFVWVGMCAGAGVGLLDGARAAWAVGADVVGGALAMALAAAVDAVAAFAVALACEATIRLALWGRQKPRAVGWEMFSSVLFGMAVAASTLGAASGAIERKNRFLAAGIAALVSLGAAALGALLIPALARLLSRFRAAPAGATRDPITAPSVSPIVWLSIPVTLAAGASVVLVGALRVRGALNAPASRVGVVLMIAGAIVFPGALVFASRLRMGGRLVDRLGHRRAAVLSGALVGAAATTLTILHWSNDLRFLPWTHIVVGALVALVSGLSLWALSRRTELRFPRRMSMFGGIAVCAAVAVSLLASESETARKATFAHAAWVGPLLVEARRVLDRDRDGASKFFGGGDCDDGDASIHPGTLDYPDDGVDQDCDGHDARLATLLPPPFAPVPAAVPADLNLLLITIDTLRADHLGAYGYARPTSPEIDRLATSGALFLNGWAHAPSTRYSMPAIATGRWPSAIAWDESIWWPRIAPSVRTIGESLKAAGYFTAALYSFDYFSLADHRGFERGIDLFRDDRAALHHSVNGPMESHGSSSQQMADDAIAVFESHRSGKVFAWVHFYDPHLSYEPHDEVPSFGSQRMDLYDGEIRFTDLHLGRLFQRLRDLGLWDRTAVIITGDHGEGFGEHGITEHGFDLYPAQTKVPFIIRVPGLPPRRISRPAGHVDLAPTLLNLARAPQEPNFLGRSLLPELSGVEPTTASPVVFQEVSSERGKKRALVSADWQVIWNWTPDNTTECYDRQRDPDAKHDLWGHANAPECRRLKASLQEMVSVLSVPPDLSAKLSKGLFPPGAPMPAPRTPLDARVGDGIRVLGQSASATHVRAGQNVDVELYFECTKVLPVGWRPFFHLLGPGGTFRNLDHIPLEGAMPLERWRPGQRLIDRFSVSLPVGSAPGSYRLIFGLFKGAARQPIVPVAASDGNGALRVLEIQLDRAP